MAHPVGVALLPLVVRSHDTLLSTRNPGPTPTRLAELRSLEERVDGRHDDVLRGIHFLLVAHAFLVRAEAVKERLDGLRRKLLPDGLVATQRSYRDQVGQAELAESRLDDDDRAWLARIGTVDGGTFGDAITEWFELARELGRLEHERGGDRTPGEITVSEARSGWIRAMRLLYDALSMQDSLPDALAAIVTRIETATREAARRASLRTGGADQLASADEDQGDGDGEAASAIGAGEAAEAIDAAS